jgi:Ser/Thr protein kinase RdoA (MazF antagonist)
MPRGGANFSSEELVRVLSHYDIGVILQIKPLSGGNKRAPKMAIVSEQGKYLLKRRPKGNDDLYRVTFAHAVQSYLAAESFPVTSLLATRNENNTILQLNHHIYELFKFVTGTRYDGSPEATIDAGRKLAEFHRHLSLFAYESALGGLKGCFHDSSTVRRHLKTLGSDRSNTNKTLRATADKLMALYNESSVNVNECGFDSWKQQVVHGDWHPGNMLFSKDKLAAVLDFDSVRIAPPLTDLANGMLQFSIIGGRPNPADWPDYFDQDKLVQFLSGYREVIKLNKEKLESLSDLMIETMIAEAVLPIVATGFFGHLSGEGFLKMILRKSNWLNKNHNKLAKAICE